MKPAPLFILAPPRSFTTISCAMLGCHPQMFGLAEINLFARDTVAELLELHRMRGRMQQGLLRSLSELAFNEQTEDTIDAAKAWLADNADMSTAELYRTMQEWAGDRGLIDKSPLHVYMPAALGRIGRAAPDARYLHLTRHPADTVRSIFQLRDKIREKTRERFAGASRLGTDDRAGNWTPDKMWLEPHLSILEFLESIPPERQMRLQGEDLLSDPANYLRQIAEWLEIGSADSDVEAMLHPENSPFASYGPKNATYGNDPSFMEHPQLRPYRYEPHPLVWQNPKGETLEMSEVVRAYAMIFGY